MSRKITARAIILDNDGKLFCVKLKAHIGKDIREFWCVPGGGIDPAEPIIDALHREMIEETNVAPEIGELLYIQQYKESDTEEQLEFFFHITNYQDYQDIDISGASHAEEEIADHGFKDPASTYILPEFLSTEDVAAHISDRLPTKVFNYL